MGRLTAVDRDLFGDGNIVHSMGPMLLIGWYFFRCRDIKFSRRLADMNGYFTI